MRKVTQVDDMLWVASSVRGSHTPNTELPMDNENDHTGTPFLAQDWRSLEADQCVHVSKRRVPSRAIISAGRMCRGAPERIMAQHGAKNIDPPPRQRQPFLRSPFPQSSSPI